MNITNDMKLFWKFPSSEKTINNELQYIEKREKKDKKLSIDISNIFGEYIFH